MLTDTEKEYLRKLIEKDLEKFQTEEKGIVDMSPGFLKGEEEYEEFLKRLLEKLK
ncbi:hypothetical protein JW707_03135 [Candidatus Woesearchaeota archaeon]|nr:hypothetical protein [Candidatus Woesearchaeota archaeon]